MADMSPSVDILIRRIRFIMNNDVSNIRQALYFRLLRITQYLAWKFPAYGAVKQLLDDVVQCRTQIGRQNEQLYFLGIKTVQRSH